MKNRDIVIVGILTSLMCIFSVVILPINTIPITLSVFSVFFISTISGLKKSLFTVIIYILCGCLGLPVFSGFQGGFSVLFGPTGGYITGYLFISIIVGSCSDKAKKFTFQKRFNYLLISSFIALILCYMLGTIQFSLITNLHIKEAVFLCVYPFILFDIIKIVMAIILAETTRKHLKFIIS